MSKKCLEWIDINDSTPIIDDTHKAWATPYLGVFRENEDDVLSVVDLVYYYGNGLWKDSAGRKVLVSYWLEIPKTPTKVESIKPKFKVGDIITNGRATGEIVNINTDYAVKFRMPSLHYVHIHFSEQDEWSLVEQKSSVWHDIKEMPKMGRQVLLQHIDEWYHVGCVEMGKFDEPWVSDGVAAFKLSIFSKWAYIDDLMKL